MQQFEKKQNTKVMTEKLITGLTGIAWVAGLLIAGSESSYMPWVNGLGLIIFSGASLLLGKQLRNIESSSSVIVCPEIYQKSSLRPVTKEKNNSRVNTRYALGI
jgi:hypothetical protein